MIIRVTDSSHAGEARRHAALLAEDAKLGERESGSLAIAVTEMVTNLVKHAGNGTVIVEAVANNGSSGVRLLGLDRGPGIRDLSAALRDGFSTAGTAGNGLGAIKRLCNTFDIYTSARPRDRDPGGILATTEKNSHPLSPLEVGVVSVPIKGEDVCGDGWGVKKTAESMLLHGRGWSWSWHSGCGSGTGGAKNLFYIPQRFSGPHSSGLPRCVEEDPRRGYGSRLAQF